MISERGGTKYLSGKEYQRLVELKEEIMINIDQLKHDYYLPALKHISSLQQTDSFGKTFRSDQGWFYYMLPNEIQFEIHKVKNILIVFIV